MILDDISAPVTKPHLESQMPYGYRFDAIDVIKFTDFEEAFNFYGQMDELEYRIHSIDIGRDNPHVDRIIFEIAAHIEGNFGMPFPALIVFSNAHSGMIRVYVPTSKGSWWNRRNPVNYAQLMSNYLMGLRSLLDILK